MMQGVGILVPRWGQNDGTDLKEWTFSASILDGYFIIVILDLLNNWGFEVGQKTAKTLSK
jgi:hypothetical protein